MWCARQWGGRRGKTRRGPRLRFLLAILLFHLADPWPAPFSQQPPTADAVPQEEFFKVGLDLGNHPATGYIGAPKLPRWLIKQNNHLDPPRLGIEIDVFSTEITADTELRIELVDVMRNEPQVLDAAGNPRPPWKHQIQTSPDSFVLDWSNCRLKSGAAGRKFQIRVSVAGLDVSRTTGEFLLEPWR